MESVASYGTVIFPAVCMHITSISIPAKMKPQAAAISENKYLNQWGTEDSLTEMAPG